MTAIKGRGRREGGAGGGVLLIFPFKVALRK